MRIFIIILIVGLVLWTAWSYYISNAISLSYKVIDKKDLYEIRQYDPYIAMQVEVENSDYEQAQNEAFKILAGYIFGGNSGKQSIAMTTPVTTNKKEGESIAMTTPVTTNKKGNKIVMTFSAPPEYTLDTLPRPDDSRISFLQIPSKKIAAYRFGIIRSQDKIEENKKKFLGILEENKEKVLAEPVFAGYNGPWTIPFLIRNEILVEIE